MKAYPLVYQDQFGKEETTLFSDGTKLSLTLRGVTFEGACFETLETEALSSLFEYDSCNCLTNFKTDIEFLILLVDGLKEQMVKLNAHVETGKEPVVWLSLETPLGVFSNKRNSGHFEDALVEIERQLPPNMKIKTCLSCRYSHYHPIGNGMFGGLICLKNRKEEALKIDDKRELMELIDKELKEKTLLSVNEVYWCEEHQFVVEGDWVYKLQRQLDE